MNDMSIAMQDASETDWSAGAAYIKGRFVPIAEAGIPVTDWGYRRSDVTYDGPTRFDFPYAPREC